MKNIQKLSLSLLLLAGVGTTQTRKKVETLGSGVSEVPAGVLDYTIFLPATAKQNKDDKDSNDRSVGQTVMTPVTATGDLVQSVLTVGQTHPFEKDFGSCDDDNRKSKKNCKKECKKDKKSCTEKKSSCKKDTSCRKKSKRNHDDDMDSMTSDNADSLL